MKRRAEFADAAVEALANTGKTHRRFVLDGIRVHLIENDPAEISGNKFPLKRPSAHTERELRLENWRVFYSLRNEGRLVVINLIGEKQGNRLIIGGEEFRL